MSDEDRHNAVRRAFTNARRLQAMTRDVLDTESIESGRFGYVRHPMDLADEVRTAVDGVRRRDSAENLVLTVPDTPVDGGRRPRPHPAGAGEPARQRAQERAVRTARSRSPSSTTDRVARLVVEDHGAGIDPDQIERIFDKFVRGRADSVTGTGLGLYISRRIVEAHEGRIWAESRPGQPTRFVVELPCQTLVTT